jgi:bacterioferritin-associated ferredoxin
LAALQDVLGVATCCGCCRKHVMGMLHHVQQGYSPGETAQEAWLDMQVSQ